MGQLNYFLLPHQCSKVVGPALAHYWHAHPPFANDFHNLSAMAQLSVLLGYFLNNDIFKWKSFDKGVFSNIREGSCEKYGVKIIFEDKKKNLSKVWSTRCKKVQ